MRLGWTALGLAWALGAHAQQATPEEDPQAAARAHFEAGTRAFDTGEYARAAEEFRAAHALMPHADLLFNIYSAEERGGNLGPAAEALDRYLQEGRQDDPRREALTARLAHLRARLAEQRAAAAEAEAARQRELVEAARRDEPASPPPPPSSGVHPAGVGVLIGGGALAAGWVVFAILSEVEDGSLDGTCGTSCTRAQVGTLAALNTLADVTLVATGAVAVTGLVLLFALPPEGGASAAASARVLPWASPGGGGLVLQGSF